MQLHGQRTDLLLERQEDRLRVIKQLFHPLGHWQHRKGALDWNRRKVQNLTAREIWFFIAGRVFMSFGLGVLVMKYVPELDSPLAIPTLIIGALLLFVAAKGFLRKRTDSTNDNNAA